MIREVLLFVPDGRVHRPLRQESAVSTLSYLYRKVDHDKVTHPLIRTSRIWSGCPIAQTNGEVISVFKILAVPRTQSRMRSHISECCTADLEGASNSALGNLVDDFVRHTRCPKHLEGGVFLTFLK